MFDKGVKVITSKGRFGIIVESTADSSVVRMGQKNYDIANIELIEAIQARAVRVDYTEGFEPKSCIIHIKAHVVAFDINAPMSNPLYDNVKDRFIAKCGPHRIDKLTLV